tara:strand:+ start:67 stop:603 length:537 start_codon:yes stop_codon:yes gene_type:complete
MKDFEVIDDVISIGYQNRIKDYMACPRYPWFYGNRITRGDKKDTDPYSGFFNIIYDPSNFTQGADTLYPVLLEALGDVQPKELMRIRAAMFIRNQNGSNIKHHLPHVDRPNDKEPYKVAIYYVIDSDGSTGIFDGDELIEEVNPKQGRMLIMDGDVYHASHCPKKHDQRIVVNYNFRI